VTILASVLPLPTSNVLKLTATDTRCLKLFVTMSKTIWKLYNDNMISEEVAHILLDAHYNRLNNKRYK